MKKYREYSSPDEVETTQFTAHPNRVNTFLPIHRRSLRLPDVDYASRECLCFATFNLHPRCGISLENEIAQTAWRTLNLEIEKTKCDVLAICLMPDHVHLLISPSGNGKTVSDLICRFKSVIYQAVQREHDLHLKWQTSFYDHIVRNKKIATLKLNSLAAIFSAIPNALV